MAHWPLLLLQLFICQVTHSEVIVTRQDQHEDPTITVAEGRMVSISYNVTHNRSDNITLLLQMNGRRNIPRAESNLRCTQPDLELALVSKRCTDGGMKTEWYVLLVQGSQDVNNVTIACEYLINGNTRDHRSCGKGLDARIVVLTEETPITTAGSTTDTTTTTTATATTTNKATGAGVTAGNVAGTTAPTPATTGKTTASLGAVCNPKIMPTDIITTLVAVILLILLLVNTFLLCVQQRHSCDFKSTNNNLHEEEYPENLQTHPPYGRQYSSLSREERKKGENEQEV